MLKIIGLILVGIVVVVLVLAAMKPDEFRMQRSATIKAPPAKVFALVNDFKAWPQWSPWEKKDPAMKRTVSANSAGKGATYAWEGNKEVGQGSMTIVESTPDSKVLLDLDFVKPFETHNKITFTFAPQGDSTVVTWEMRGPVPYFAKIFHVFMDMDAMVGKDFESGFAAMKAAAEGNEK